MKLLLNSLCFISLALPAYSASISLTFKDWYVQSYALESTLVPNKKQTIEIALDRSGAGELQMPTRHYKFRRDWDYCNEATIDQKVRVQSAQTSCQITFEAVMSLHYCSVKKLQNREDCNVTHTETKQETFSCADLLNKKIESTVTYEVWEKLKNDFDLRYYFSNTIYANNLILKTAIPEFPSEGYRLVFHRKQKTADLFQVGLDKSEKAIQKDLKCQYSNNKLTQ